MPGVLDGDRVQCRRAHVPEEPGTQAQGEIGGPRRTVRTGRLRSQRLSHRRVARTGSRPMPKSFRRTLTRGNAATRPLSRHSGRTGTLYRYRNRPRAHVTQMEVEVLTSHPDCAVVAKAVMPARGNLHHPSGSPALDQQTLVPKRRLTQSSIPPVAPAPDAPIRAPRKRMAAPTSCRPMPRTLRLHPPHSYFWGGGRQRRQALSPAQPAPESHGPAGNHRPTAPPDPLPMPTAFRPP